MAALKDPKSFPAPPVHRIAHGESVTAAPPTQSLPPQQPPQAQPYGYPQYQQPPGAPQYLPVSGQPSYGQYQPPTATPAAAQPAFQPPQVSSQYGQYQPQAQQNQPPTPQYQPPTSQYQPPASQYQPPAQQYQPPVQQYVLPGQPPSTPQAPYQPPQNNYVPPGNGPMNNVYHPPGTTGHPVPQLPPRANSIAHTSSPVQPSVPPRANSVASASSGPTESTSIPKPQLPDPLSFPKPPPFYGRQVSTTGTPAATSALSLPQRNTPSPVVVGGAASTTAPPPYVSTAGPPPLPSRQNPGLAHSTGVSSLHKKPPPPVKPKPFQRQASLTPTPTFHAGGDHAAVNAITAQLDQANLNSMHHHESNSISQSSPGGPGSIRDKIQALNSTQPNFASQIASRFNPVQTQSEVAPHAPIHKKAPPVPVKKFATSGDERQIAQPHPPVSTTPTPTAPASDVPPPINFATRPQDSQITNNSVQEPVVPAAQILPPQAGQKEFDLQLSTLWFAQPINNLKLPVTLSGLNYVVSTSFSGGSHTLILAIRISEDLSIVKYKLTWQAHDPLGTVKAERKAEAGPQPLPQTQLIQAQEQFGNGVASWAEAMLGRQVGDGECWTLAKEAIDQSSHQYALSPQGYTHGALVYHAIGGATAPLAYNDSIRRGDILQFTSGKFESRNAQGLVVFTNIVGQPNHTSVVSSVSADNRVVQILQQNVNGVKVVQKGEHNLDELVAGELKIFRPVWKEWAGELQATW